MPGSSTVELWTLYAFGVSFTVLRTYARISAVGVRELQVDDYLIWFAIVSSLAEIFCWNLRNMVHLTDIKDSSFILHNVAWGTA